MQRRKKAHPGEDNHHLLYSRKAWKKGYYYALRTHYYCIALVAKKTLHREIHQAVSNVPLPREENAKFVLDQLNMFWEFGMISNDDSIEKRLSVLIELFEPEEQPTADALRKELEVVRKFYKKPP